jgi:hypothetical protein
VGRAARAGLPHADHSPLLSGALPPLSCSISWKIVYHIYHPLYPLDTTLRHGSSTVSSTSSPCRALPADDAESYSTR